MDKKQYTLTVVLSMLTGLVGGVASSWLFMGTPVFAQKPEVAGVIRARSFVVVDENGKTRAEFGLMSSAKLTGAPVLSLLDKEGKKVRAALGLWGKWEEPELRLSAKDGHYRALFGLWEEEGRPEIRLLNKDGKVIWTAP